MTTGDGDTSGIDWEKVGYLRYDGDDELMALSAAAEAQMEQFPVLRRDLRLNEGGGLFRWLSVFEITSLERSEPFLAAFGLPGCDPATLRRITKDALQAIYEVESDEAVPLSAMVEMLETALDRLAAEAGPGCADLVLEYCTERFPYFSGESRREEDWCQLLSKLVFGSSARYPTVEPALSPEALRAVHEAVRQHIDPGLNEWSYAADTAPLTPWEAVVYARCDGWSPFDVMSEVAYHFQTQAAWEAIEAALAPDELEALVDWGRRQAAVLPGMRPERIAPPPTPRRPRPT